MKKKRNLYIIAFLCFITLVGVTIAYLQSTDTFENIFNAGTYSVITHEEFTSPSNWKPGDETTKTITTTNEGTIPVLVRVKLEESWLSSNDEELPLRYAPAKFAAIINLDNEIDWILKDGYYYYLQELLPGEETTSPIKSVTFNPEYEGNINCTFNSTTNSNECSSSNEYMGGTYTLNITTETVQADAYQTLWENAPIMYDYVGDNPCTYNGELEVGSEYIDGQYTYRYRQSPTTTTTPWYDLEENGWNVRITDPESTDPIITPLCTSINSKPIVSMRQTFYNSQATSIDLSSYDTSNVTDMKNMFVGSKVTSLNLSRFNKNKVVDMSGMFGKINLNTLNLTSLDTSNVTDMKNMFNGASIQNLNLSNFNTSKVTIMYGMFRGFTGTILDLTSFDTSNVTHMGIMFYEADIESVDLSSFDTSNVTSMNAMFHEAVVDSLDLTNFDTSKVTDMIGMFSNCSATTINVSSFTSTTTVRASTMFSNTKVQVIDLSNLDTSNFTDMSWMFNNTLATIGYARTQADADRLNATSNKPSTLTFVVKGS